MTNERANGDLEAEESAQGHDLFRAPGDDLLLAQARDQAEASGWIAEEDIKWPSPDIRAGVVNRRQDLYDAMRHMESAVARPSGMADWRIEIEGALSALESCLRDHIEQVEADRGLFAEVLEHAPNLASDIASLKKEHIELLEACHNALSMAADWSSAAIRRRVNILLGRLAIHRQYGAELLYDAYNVDIAVGN